jgi:hypothetical protein
VLREFAAKRRGNCRRCRQRKVGNRPQGGYVFGERSKPKTVGQKTYWYTKLPKRLAFWFCRYVLAIQLSACADAIHQESLAVGCPPYVCQPVLMFSSNLFGSIAHRGGRDARVPIRFRFAAIVGCADIGVLVLLVRVPLPLSASTPTQPPGSRLPTLRLPTRFGIQFKLFWFYHAQRRAGRPRSSPFPLRGIFGGCRCVSDQNIGVICKLVITR